MTALAIGLGLGLIVADVLHSLAWRRWVAKQRARTDAIAERAE